MNVKKLMLPAISLAVLIAGAVMLGIGINKYQSSGSGDSTGFQLSNALSSTSKQQRQRPKRDAPKKPTVIILGISAARQGGVTVMSGLLFSISYAPDAAQLRDSINSMSNTYLLNMIGNFLQSTSAQSTATTSRISTSSRSTSLALSSSTAGTTTPSSTATSSLKPSPSHPIVISTPSPTTTSSPKPSPSHPIVISTPSPTTTSSPKPSPSHPTVISTPSPTTTSSPKPTPSQSTETTTMILPTGPTGSLPCLVDIAIAFDASNVAGKPNLVEQINFVANQLSSKWVVNPAATEVYAIAGGLDDASHTQGDMNYTDLAELHRDLLHLSCSPLQGDESIEEQFGEFAYSLWNKRKNVRLLTMVFTYASLYEDVKSALYYVDEFSSNNNKIVIIAIGDRVNVRLLKSITGSVIAANHFDEDLSTKINAEICSPKLDRLPLPEAPSTTPQSSTTSTAPATTHLPTESPQHSNLTCSVNIAIIMDASNAAGVINIKKQAEFIRQHLVSSWKVAETETELELYASAYEDYKGGKYMWNYPSNLQVYDDLDMLQTVGPFGDVCLDCAILLVSKDWMIAPYGRPHTNIFFAYDTRDLDSQFAESDVARIISPSPKDKLIIVGVGSKVNSTQLRAITSHVLLTDGLNEDLAVKDFVADQRQDLLKTYRIFGELAQNQQE
ncbi:unnamed protein product [Anisakis simplex]|uniref:VWFA domain-containing protein n=1 Tax=Anisakis simplex TaxID=6269 RepID=A0A0M3K3V8_ANISI|nr:unnamed protein product [Anisakis simplex]